MNIVFDLDGTLADITHRLHFIKGPVKDWRAFFAACPGDRPIVPIVNLCRQLILVGNRVDIWSGRSDEVRHETEQWLNQYTIGYRQLLMRSAGDHRPDNELKDQWVSRLPLDELPQIAFDDRQQVVDMWRRHGIICCQVATGDF